MKRSVASASSSVQQARRLGRRVAWYEFLLQSVLVFIVAVGFGTFSTDAVIVPNVFSGRFLLDGAVFFGVGLTLVWVLGAWAGRITAVRRQAVAILTWMLTVYLCGLGPVSALLALSARLGSGALPGSALIDGLMLWSVIDALPVLFLGTLSAEFCRSGLRLFSRFVVTKRGRPVAPSVLHLRGDARSLRGSVTYHHDIVTPLEEPWDVDR